MPLAEIGRYAVTVLLTGALGWAAVTDARDRRIPNLSVLMVLGLFAVWACLHPLSAFFDSLLVGVGALVVCYGLYAFNIIGAGDAKLIAAVALFAGTPFLGPFVMGTVLSGGVMAVVSLASRPNRAIVIFQMRGKGEFGRGIPYGVAIGIGGVIMQWGRLLHLLTPYTMFGFVP
jgi:prepilin peptidase CpaA